MVRVFIIGDDEPEQLDLVRNRAFRLGILPHQLTHTLKRLRQLFLVLDYTDFHDLKDTILGLSASTGIQESPAEDAVPASPAKPTAARSV